MTPGTEVTVASDVTALLAEPSEAGAAPQPGGGATIEDAREQHERDAARFSPPDTRDAVDTVDQLSIGAAATRINARMYRPAGDATATLVWLHGGGWVSGSLETADVIARALAARAHSVVISIEYRRAPEHPWPTPYLDSLEATRWVLDHLADLGAPATVLVGGDSAGGNLAAAVAMELGHRKITGQVLLYPVVAIDEPQSAYPSRTANAFGYHVGWADIDWSIGRYLLRASDGADPRVSLLRNASFHDAPPAVIVTAQYDPLRDEGNRFAEVLRVAGIPTRLIEFDGLVHGFFDMIGRSTTAAAAMDVTAAAVRELTSRAVR